MGRTFFRLFLRGVILTFFFGMKSFESFGVMSVFDSSNYANLTQIITASNKLLNEQKHLGASVDDLNSAFGNPLPFDFSKLERMMKRKSFSLSDFSLIQSSIPGFEPLKSDFTSHRAGYEGALLARFNEKGMLSHEEHQKVGQRREALFKESVLSGLALAAQQKESLQTSQAELSSVLKEANLARDLRSDIALTNRLLSLIVNESIQMRALLLQQLEIKSAASSQKLPISLTSQDQTQPSPSILAAPSTLTTTPIRKPTSIPAFLTNTNERQGHHA